MWKHRKDEADKNQNKCKNLQMTVDGIIDEAERLRTIIITMLIFVKTLTWCRTRRQKRAILYGESAVSGDTYAHTSSFP